jgi:hypothetical protein
MRNRQSRVQRQGQIYRFSVNGAEYAAFIWQLGVRFQGRIEGQPQVPQCIGRSGRPCARPSNASSPCMPWHSVLQQ